MSIRNLGDIAPDERIESDVCVVGSGPAGTTLVRELAGSGLDVLLVESGGRDHDPATNALSEIDNVGTPRVLDQSGVRPRVLGGASAIWSGRCATFDEIDFEARPWVPHSGWPIRPDDLTPYFDRTAAHLGLGVGSGFADRGPPGHDSSAKRDTALDASIVRPFFWQFSRDAENRFDSMRFGRRLSFAPSDNVRVVANATVVHINTNETATAVRSVEVAAPDGGRRTFRARAVVLCAGGIENARLLLASRRAAPAGLGNSHDRVGRFLMDHPRGGVASLDHTRAADVNPYMAMRLLPTGNGAFLFCKGWRLSPEVQQNEGLLNCAVWLSEAVMDDDPWSAVKRLLRREGRMAADLKAIASNLGFFMRGAYQGIVQRDIIPRKLSALELNCAVEQRPDPDSRITLSDRLDRFGVPLSRVNWRVNEHEQQTVRRTAELVCGELTRLGISTPVLADWVRDKAPFPPSFRDNAHHIGTTRMSADPRDGVVDPNCQVHGVHGLFVAGSSVFPTAGHANPTQMIVALAVRLADKLKQRVSSAKPGQSVSEPEPVSL